MLSQEKMNSSEAKARFEALLSQCDKRDFPDVIISCMLDFYRDERVEDCRIEDDGDMLLYQWGTYDWGQGRWFDLNITRQFIPQGGEDDDIFQLSVTAKYSPAPDLDELCSGNKWCGSPDEFPQFEEFVRGSNALKHLTGRPGDKVAITCNLTG